MTTTTNAAANGSTDTTSASEATDQPERVFGMAVVREAETYHTASVDRDEPNGPDRPPVRRRLLRLVVPRPRPRLGERGYTELDFARVDPESHGLVLSGM